IDGSARAVSVSSVPYNSAFQYATPIAASSGTEIWNVEGTSPGPSPSPRQLTKRTPYGTLIWSNSLPVGDWTIGADKFGGVHVGIQNGPGLARYDYDGNLAWTLSLPAVCKVMITDQQGNRFVSLSSGAVARLGDEPVSAPVITNAPQGQTVMAGTNVTLTV